jgi:hypothetical protein
VFMSKLENPTYSYDNEGHLHVPPLQPGRLPPQISTRESSYAAANPSNTGGGTVSSFFGGLFNKNSGSTRVAATDMTSTGSTSAASPQTHTGFFSSLFSSNNTQQANAPADTEQTASAAPAKPNKPAARPRPNTDSQKSAPQVADTTKPKAAPTTTPSPAPQKEANGAAPPSNNGMLNGAQPVVPAGSFSNRWGFQ